MIVLLSAKNKMDLRTLPGSLSAAGAGRRRAESRGWKSGLLRDGGDQNGVQAVLSGDGGRRVVDDGVGKSLLLGCEGAGVPVPYDLVTGAGDGPVRFSDAAPGLCSIERGNLRKLGKTGNWPEYAGIAPAKKLMA